MKAGSSVLVIILGLIMLWAATSGKLGCFKLFGNCMAGSTMFGSTGGTAAPTSGSGSDTGSILTLISDFFGSGDLSGGGGNAQGDPGQGAGSSNPFDPGQTGNPSGDLLQPTQSARRSVRHFGPQGAFA